jgi:hypothetical protein
MRNFLGRFYDKDEMEGRRLDISTETESDGFLNR